MLSQKTIMFVTPPNSPSLLPTRRKLANELRALTSSSFSSSSSSPPPPIGSCCEYLETRDQRGTKVLPAHPRKIKEASWEDTHTPTGTRNYSVRFRNTPINPPLLSFLPPFPSQSNKASTAILAAPSPGPETQ